MQALAPAIFPGSLLAALQSAPARPAFEQGQRTVTRGELLELIRRLAGGLEERGLGRGHGVAILTAITPEAFAVQMALYALGCRVVGIRNGYSPAQLAHVLGGGIHALLVDPANASSELLRAAAALRLLSLGPCPGAHDLLARSDSSHPLATLARPDDVAALFFTSGSTGLPKGCALTYRALTSHWSWQEPCGWSPVARELGARFERYLLYGTLASLVVMEFVALCLLGGGTAVIPDPLTQPLFPDVIERQRITGAIITVPRFNRMLDALHAERASLKSLRALMVSGSPISPGRLESAVTKLGPIVYQGYGQTEAGSISMLTPADIADRPSLALASVGRPHPSVEVSVRDGLDRPVAAGEVGEIYVQSPYQMAGYWEQPEATRDTLRDGWLCTRDLGRMDQEGLLHLVGRTRDVVMVNAMVVYVGPIERALASHPDVDEAYVVGAPDEHGGEAAYAFIVPKAGRSPDHAALAALVRSELGDDSVPRRITNVIDVPVAASGKPDKRALLATLERRARA